jgi:hypothetical protein
MSDMGTPQSEADDLLRDIATARQRRRADARATLVRDSTTDDDMLRLRSTAWIDRVECDLTRLLERYRAVVPALVRFQRIDLIFLLRRELESWRDEIHAMCRSTPWWKGDRG